MALGERWIGDFPRALAAALASHREARALITHEAREISSALDRSGIRHAFLKGFAFERLYQPAGTRQFDDLDIALPSVDLLWDSLVVLGRRGYGLDALSLARDQDGGHFVASATLTSMRSGVRVEVELQAAGFAIHWASRVPFDDDFWNGVEVDDVLGLPIPSARHSALTLLAELVERPRILVRDLHDVRALRGVLTERDRVWLTERAPELGLRAALAHYSAVEAGGRPMSSALRRNHAVAPIWRCLERPRQHVWPYCARRLPLPGAVATTFASVLYDFAELTLRQGMLRGSLVRLASSLDGRRMLEAGLYVRLLPIAPRPVGQLSWRGAGSSALLITPVGAFAASPFPELPPERIRLLSSAVKAAGAEGDLSHPS